MQILDAIIPKKEREAMRKALNVRIAALQLGIPEVERREGHKPSTAKRLEKLWAELEAARAALALLEPAPGKTIDACQCCTEPVQRGQRFVAVVPVGARDGKAPAPDLFHARCSGAFRSGWGA